MLSFKQFISEVIDLEKRKISKAKARYDYVGRELDKYSEYKNALNDNRSKPPNERMTTRDFHDHIKGISTEGHPSHDPKSPLYGIKIPSYDIALRIGDVPLGRAPKKEVTPRPPPFPHKEEWVKDALQSHDSTSRPTLEGYRVAMNSHEGNTNELEANKRDVLRAIKHHEITWPKPKIEKPKIEKPKIKKPKITDEQFMNSHNKMPDHWSFSQRSSALNNEYRKRGLSTSSGSYQIRLKKIQGKLV